MRPFAWLTAVALATTLPFSAACGSSDDSSSSGIDGTYTGTYSGDDSGAVKMTVSGTKVDVVATVGGKDYPGSGGLEGSQLSVGIGVGGGVSVAFSGTFADGKGSGSWQSSTGTKGSWSVAK